MTVEIFAEQKLICGEGPLWDVLSGTVFWTDSGANEIYFSNEKDELPHVFSKGERAASLALHHDGGLVCCGTSSVFHLSSNGTIKMFSNVVNGIETSSLNDIIADPTGRVLVGQESFTDETPDRTGYLFRMDTDGTLQIVEEGLHLANGMGFSPAADRFYLVDSIPGKIYEYSYNAFSGELSNKKTLVSIPKESGLPDGLTVDGEGFIWVARWFGYSIARYDPDGKLERSISLPASQISSLTFGGKDLNHIYVTSAAAEWKTPLAPANESYGNYRGGRVYRIIQDIQGKKEHRAKISY